MRVIVDADPALGKRMGEVADGLALIFMLNIFKLRDLKLSSIFFSCPRSIRQVAGCLH